MQQNLPTIWKQANLVAVQIRQAVVERFARLYRYDIGIELIANSRAVVRATRIALRDRSSYRRGKIQALSDAIDELKDSMQHAGELGAFASTREFEAIAREIRRLGQQCGGWLNEQAGKGQSGPASSIVARQRAQTLSARDASQGANP